MEDGGGAYLTGLDILTALHGKETPHLSKDWPPSMTGHVCLHLVHDRCVHIGFATC